jgi:hypothetical protein
MQWIQAFLGFIFDLFFGCRHDHLTRPFTLQAHSYKICLDCGRELPYSLTAMRLLRPWEISRQPKEQPAEILVTATALSVDKPYTDWKAVA